MLIKRIEAVDGFAHYHMDPTAHDEKALATLRSLFDAVVELKDGAWHRH